MAVFPIGQTAVIANVSSSVSSKEPTTGALRTLADLPANVWELVKEPPPGYHFRTHAFTPGVTWDTLLDGGAAFSLIAEESLIHGINCSNALGGVVGNVQARDRLHRGPGLKPLRLPTEGPTNGVAWRVCNAAYDQVCGMSAGNPKVAILS